nr:NTP transferase domain-containing protein [Nakamurella flavida]
MDAAVVLAGGSGRRLGGVDKPSLTKDGRSLLDRCLAAVGPVPTVVVGPSRILPAHCRQVREDPPGSGPAAAVATALPLIDDLAGRAVVALLAADLPGITPTVVARLAGALTGEGDGVVLVDPAGRRQILLGVWRVGALRTAVQARGDWTDIALRRLLAPLTVLEVAGGAEESADVDTPADLARWRGITTP